MSINTIDVSFILFTVANDLEDAVPFNAYFADAVTENMAWKGKSDNLWWSLQRLFLCGYENITRNDQMKLDRPISFGSISNKQSMG